jgi:hypothetical protein
MWMDIADIPGVYTVAGYVSNSSRDADAGCLPDPCRDRWTHSIEFMPKLFFSSHNRQEGKNVVICDPRCDCYLRLRWHLCRFS